MVRVDRRRETANNEDFAFKLFLKGLSEVEMRRYFKPRYPHMDQEFIKKRVHIYYGLAKLRYKRMMDEMKQVSNSGR